MKRVYESPFLYVESFTANKAVAAGTCTSQMSYSWDYDCMAGPLVDTVDTLIAVVGTILTCTTKAGYIGGETSSAEKGTYTAINQANTNDSTSQNNSTIGGTWSRTDEGYAQVSYSNVYGLFYVDNNNGNFHSNQWEPDEAKKTVTHNNVKDSGGEHVMVAPLSGIGSVSIS